MATQKALKARLLEIKDEAAELAKGSPDDMPSGWNVAKDAANLAEEAAGLALELIDKRKEG